MKILIIEDNELNRDMLSRRLIKKDYLVVCAKDGEEGLEMVKQENPDLLLMDLSLPKIDGWSLAQKLKADDKTKNIPIIALTAHAMKGDREKAIEAGCDEYDTKPINFPNLLKKINKFSR